MSTTQQRQRQKFIQERRFILGQTAMLFSVLVFVFGLIGSNWILLIAVAIFVFGAILRTTAKEKIHQAADAFVKEDFTPAIERRCDVSFSPEKGMPRTFFEGMKILPLEEEYDSYQRLEGREGSVDFKAAFVRIAPRKKRSRTFETLHASFAGKVFHAVYDSSFIATLRLHDNPDAPNKGTRRGERGVFVLDTNAPIRLENLFEEPAYEALSRFLEPFRSHFELYFHQNHLVVLLYDYKPFARTAYGMVLDEGQIEETVDDIERFRYLIRAIESDKTLFGP